MDERTPRRVTLALIAWNLVTISGPLAVAYAIGLAVTPDAVAGLASTVLLIGVPALVVSILAGLFARAGVEAARRLSGSEPVSAGIGAALVAFLPLGFFLGAFPAVVAVLPGPLPTILAFVVVFALNAGFVAVWLRRR